MTYTRTPVEWPEIDPATVAPLRNGRPDMFNYMPTRFVTQEEAQARGWVHFYIGQRCPRGHQAPRMVCNPALCVDCKRVAAGRRPIGTLVEGYVPRVGRAAASVGGSHADASKVDVPPGKRAPYPAPGRPLDTVEPDPLEKRFLRVYAEKRDFEVAAKELGRTAGEFQARLSYSKPFRDAVQFLEDQYGLSHTVILTEPFPWTDDKRKALIHVYVNTGDLAEAIRVTGCTNWHYEEELRTNQEFAAAIELAQDPAKRALAREAVSRGLKGNDRMLQAVLEANLPEYSKRMDINFNVRQLTDDQINQRLFQLLERANGIKLIESDNTLEGDYTSDESAGADEVVGDAGAAGTEDPAESNLDLL